MAMIIYFFLFQWQHQFTTSPNVLLRWMPLFYIFRYFQPLSCTFLIHHCNSKVELWKAFLWIYSVFQNITFSNGSNFPYHSGQKFSKRTKKGKPKSEKANKPIKGDLKKKNDWMSLTHNQTPCYISWAILFITSKLMS